MYDTCRCLSDEEACHHVPLLRRRIATSRHAQSDASPTQMLAPPSRILVRDALGPASPEGGLKGDDTRPAFAQSRQPFSLHLEAVPEPLWCRRSSAWTTSLHRKTTAGDGMVLLLVRHRCTMSSWSFSSVRHLSRDGVRVCFLLEPGAWETFVYTDKVPLGACSSPVRKLHYDNLKWRLNRASFDTSCA